MMYGICNGSHDLPVHKCTGFNLPFLAVGMNDSPRLETKPARDDKELEDCPGAMGAITYSEQQDHQEREWFAVEKDVRSVGVGRSDT